MRDADLHSDQHSSLYSVLFSRVQLCSAVFSCVPCVFGRIRSPRIHSMLRVDRTIPSSRPDLGVFVTQAGDLVRTIPCERDRPCRGERARTHTHTHTHTRTHTHTHTHTRTHTHTPQVLARRDCLLPDLPADRGHDQQRADDPAVTPCLLLQSPTRPGAPRRVFNHTGNRS